MIDALILGGLVIGLHWWIARAMNERAEWSAHMREKVLCCPRCKLPFSEWFVWPDPFVKDARYCYPCGPLGDAFVGHSKLIYADRGVWLTRHDSERRRWC